MKKERRCWTNPRRKNRKKHRQKRRKGNRKKAVVKRNNERKSKVNESVSVEVTTQKPIGEMESLEVDVSNKVEGKHFPTPGQEASNKNGRPTSNEEKQPVDISKKAAGKRSANAEREN
jgi:hypothetical protein